jgi:hypothetical protein
MRKNVKIVQKRKGRKFIKKLISLAYIYLYIIYPSRSLGDEFLYGKFQLIEKVHHLKDFGISIHGKTPLEVAVEYKNFVDNLAAKPSLLHYPNGTFNKQESVDIRGDLETFSIIGFENNPLYEAKYFISGYPVSKAKYTEYVETGNVGMSRGEERASYKNGLQKDLARSSSERKRKKSWERVIEGYR